MRIAYVSTDPGIPYGGVKGASVHVEELVTALAAAGAEILVLVPALARDAPSPPDPVQLEVLPYPDKGAPAIERLAADPVRATWIKERLDAFDADVVYERFALHTSAGAVAARSLGIPHIVELNAPLLAEAQRYRQLDRAADADRLERAVLSEADVVLAVSGPVAAYAEQRGARRVRVVPNAVALERFTPAPPRETARSVAVLAGRLRPWHGVDTVAEAWALMGADAPELLVVGDNGPARPLLEAIGARVTGMVPHTAVPALLAGADIGLVPYAHDAPDYFSPLKLFEYLATALAVVAADIPGVRDVVTEESVVFVPKGDPHALADAVAALARDPERRRRLGKAGRALVEARHTWRHRASAILELTAELVPAEANA
jgi:glycosyltransferase involved in cell wall biosynthesis